MILDGDRRRARHGDRDRAELRDPLVPPQASEQAKNTDRLYHVLVIASIPIFVLVAAVILYCVWKFRMRPGQELKDGPPIHGNTRLEVFWTALPAAAGAEPRLLLVRGAATKTKRNRPARKSRWA